MSERTAPLLIVGNGLIGSVVAATLRGAGQDVVTVARRATGQPGHVQCDLAEQSGRAALVLLLRRLRPRRVVLTHGPSDVTWVNAHEEEAAATHVGVASVMAEAGVPTILISTDNVFPGDEGGRRPEHPIRPANPYGRMKADAERLITAAGGLVLRVSLVYGWAAPAFRATFAERCLAAAASGTPLAAPVDQEFSPVHVHDVGRVVTALCRAEPERGAEPVAHLAGPDLLSRFEFARLAYRLTRTDASLVRPCRRVGTEWETRPRFSSLLCDDFTGLPGLQDWIALSPAQGLARMIAEASAGRTATVEPAR